MLELPSASWTVAGFLSPQRDLLARFWLAAPEDLLPSLWSSPVGESTKQLVRQLDPKYVFTQDQIALRNAIGQRLQAGFQAPMAVQLLIVNFLYSPLAFCASTILRLIFLIGCFADYLSLYEAGPSMPAASVHPMLFLLRNPARPCY